MAIRSCVKCYSHKGMVPKFVCELFTLKDIQLHSIKKNCILSENVTFH